MGDTQWHMRHRVRQIEQEGPIGILVDKLDRTPRQLGSDLLLVIEGLDDVIDLVLFVPRKRRPGFRRLGVSWPHVIAVRNPAVLIESLCSGKKWSVVTQVPLAVTGGGIAERLDHFRDGQFLWMKSYLRGWNQCAADPDPIGVAAGDQR